MKTGKQLHIGLVTGTLNSGGAERMMVNLANAFSNNHSTELILVNKTGPYVEEVSPQVQLHNLNAKTGVKSVIPKLRKILSSQKHDVILSTQPHINAAVGISSISLSQKPILLFREANTPSVKYSEIGLLPNIIYRLGYRFADHFIAVSEGVNSDMQDFYGIPSNRITTIYNPVVDDSIHDLMKEEPDHPWLKQNNQPVIMTMSRLVPQKDHTTLLKAFAELRKARKAKLLILGDQSTDPSYVEIIKELIQTLKIQNDVDLTGFKPNPFSWLHRASLFVLSSKFEGLPGSLIQSLACGCPVVSTNCPSGPAEILNDGEYGKLVPVGDVDAMAKAMLESLEEKHDKYKLINRGSSFSTSSAADQYLSLIKNELNNEESSTSRS